MHPRSQWRLSLLLLCNAAGLLLLLSWTLPGTRSLWNRLDLSLFNDLNATLTDGTAWRTACAFFVSVEGDVLLALLLLGIGLLYVWSGVPLLRVKRLFELVVLGAIGVVSLVLIKDVVVERLWELRRLSPSLALPFSGVYLHETATALHVGARSGHSFPSDHAFALLYAALFFFTHRAVWHGVAVTVVLLPYVSARCIAGGHWATDVVVGSVAMVLITYSWAMATPLCNRLVCSLSTRLRNRASLTEANR